MQNERKIKFILYLRGYDILEWQAYTVQLWSGRWVEKSEKGMLFPINRLEIK
mgnify:FL=1